jgi:hypothetical protein
MAQRKKGLSGASAQGRYNSAVGQLGRTLLVLGATVALVGAVLLLAERFPGLRIGRLPGDIRVERSHFAFYFPLATSMVVSLVLTLLVWLLGRRG